MEYFCRGCDSHPCDMNPQDCGLDKAVITCAAVGCLKQVKYPIRSSIRPRYCRMHAKGRGE